MRTNKQKQRHLWEVTMDGSTDALLIITAARAPATALRKAAQVMKEGYTGAKFRGLAYSGTIDK